MGGATGPTSSLLPRCVCIETENESAYHMSTVWIMDCPGFHPLGCEGCKIAAFVSCNVHCSEAKNVWQEFRTGDFGVVMPIQLCVFGCESNLVIITQIARCANETKSISVYCPAGHRQWRVCVGANHGQVIGGQLASGACRAVKCEWRSRQGIRAKG